MIVVHLFARCPACGSRHLKHPSVSMRICRSSSVSLGGYTWDCVLPEDVAFPEEKLFRFGFMLCAGLKGRLFGHISSTTSAIRFRSLWRSSSSSDMHSSHGRNSLIFEAFSWCALVHKSWLMFASSWRHITSSSMCELVPQRAMFNVWTSITQFSKVACFGSR
jgi:hypothetical protein